MSKKSIKFILSLGILCLLLGLCIWILGYIVRPTDTDGAYSQIETLHSLPDDSVEVIVYGSSHAYLGVNTMEMYDKYGIGAYNYGYLWQTCNTTNLFLKDSLISQHPKVVLIEAANLGAIQLYTGVNAEIYYSRYIHNQKAKWEYIKQCLGDDDLERYLAYYVPLCAFHDNWAYLGERSFDILKVDPVFRKNMGYSPSDNVTEIQIPDYTTFEQWEFSFYAKDEIQNIIDTCHEEGIEVIFFTLPAQSEYCHSNAMKMIAEENDCVFIDFYQLIDEAGIDEKTDFFDVGHMNTSGATKIADYLGQYIVDHYDVTDMRTIDNNPWELAKQYS